MLKIIIPARELYDESKEEFIRLKESSLQLEHSLVSLSKWESKWHKPFLSKGEKSTDESVDYIRCMTLTQNVNPDVYFGITQEHIIQVNEYIEAPMTATKIVRFDNRPNNGIVTAEIIYYMMIAFNIPFECQKWHLNRLLTLINICDIKNQPPKKMRQSEIMSRNAALNAERRRMLNTKG